MPGLDVMREGAAAALVSLSSDSRALLGKFPTTM